LDGGNRWGLAVNAERLNWAWMGQHMPRVVALLKERRAAGDGALIDECWRRGVIKREPGWFYAAEGAVSLGTPPGQELVPPEVAALRAAFPTTATLMLRGQMVEVPSG
jgi:hypothetical protein